VSVAWSGLVGSGKLGDLSATIVLNCSMRFSTVFKPCTSLSLLRTLTESLAASSAPTTRMKLYCDNCMGGDKGEENISLNLLLEPLLELLVEEREHLKSRRGNGVGSRKESWMKQGERVFMASVEKPMKDL